MHTYIHNTYIHTCLEWYVDVSVNERLKKEVAKVTEVNKVVTVLNELSTSPLRHMGEWM
jgi:hypothetical protein